MADEVLSQAELETLLSSLASGLAPKVRDSASHAVPAPHLARSGPSDHQRQSHQAQPHYAQPHHAIVPHDSQQPQRFGQKPMAAIRALHDDFGRRASAALSSLLRSVVEVKLAWAEQLAYGDFISRVQNPTCASVVRAAPLKPNWLLDINPSILYAIIERLLGGGGEPCPVARRPLTEIELRLAARVTRLLLEELKKAWLHVLDLDLSVERVESNPRLVLSVPSDEAVVLIGFELKVNLARGMVTLCIPAGSLEPLAGKLASCDPADSLGQAVASPARWRPAEKGQHGAVELAVHLAETKIAAHEMLNLRVGDIIATETDIHSPLAVSLDGITTFRAHPGSLDAHKALRIEEKVAPPLGHDLAK